MSTSMKTAQGGFDSFGEARPETIFQFLVLGLSFVVLSRLLEYLDYEGGFGHRSLEMGGSLRKQIIGYDYLPHQKIGLDLANNNHVARNAQ